MTLIRSAILSFLMVMVNTAIAQESPLESEQWIANLSVKYDTGGVLLESIYNKVVHLPGTGCCEALALLYDQADQRNPRYQIRLSILTFRLLDYCKTCTAYTSGSAELENTLKQVYEIGDERLATQVHATLGKAYFNEGNISLTVTHYLIAQQGMEEIGLENYRNYASFLYGVGDMLYRIRDFRNSANNLLRALHYHGQVPFNRMDSLDNYWKMNSWNNLGLCYKHLGIYDSAFYAFRKAYPFAVEDFWKGLIKGNEGDLYYFQGRYDSAEALLQLDYKQSITSGEWDNAAITLQRLADITNASGNHTRALAMLREAQALEQKTPNVDYRSMIFYTMAKVYKEIGQVDSSFKYMEQYKSLSDQVQRWASANQMEIARVHMNNQEHVHDLLLLHKDRNRILLIRNFSIALIIILTIVGYLFINRLQLKAKLKHQVESNARQKAEAETALAKEQLMLYTENLREKTLQIESLQSTMTSKKLHDEQVEQIEELTHSTILTDEDWDRFKNLFTQVYPGFLVELKLRIPDITVAEQRMAALVKLQVSNKDAASMLGVSANSIYKTRQRLRTRLGLQADADLDKYFLEGVM